MKAYLAKQYALKSCPKDKESAIALFLDSINVGELWYFKQEIRKH